MQKLDTTKDIEAPISKKLVVVDDVKKVENPLTTSLREKKSQLVKKLLSLEKSDPESLSELFGNNKTRDALNNLLKDETPIEKV